LKHLDLADVGIQLSSLFRYERSPPSFDLLDPMNGRFGYVSIEMSAHSSQLAAYVDRTLRQRIFRIADGEDHLQHLFAISL
jgi:UV DNA damage repair endonuclease